MPQLTGPEQGDLHKILVEHVSVDDLRICLPQHGLPPLERFSGGGPIGIQVHDVISGLSKQYKVVELVEAALDALDQSCPPLQAWLDHHREELQRRRASPLWKITTSKWTRYAAMAALAVVGIALAIWRPWEEEPGLIRIPFSTFAHEWAEKKKTPGDDGIINFSSANKKKRFENWTFYVLGVDSPESEHPGYFVVSKKPPKDGPRHSNIIAYLQERDEFNRAIAYGEELILDGTVLAIDKNAIVLSDCLVK